MKYQRGYIDASAFKALFWALFAGGVIVGFVLFVAVPWLWRLLKPWIHQITG